MRGFHVWGRTAPFAAAGFSFLIAGCGGHEAVGTSHAGTVNLASLPAAEVWVDGKPSGATPMAVSLNEGKHEIVLKQAGFLEHRETLDIASGSIAKVDASLDPIDVTDCDTVRQIASAFGVTVDPTSAPELHRGAVSDQGVALFFPRNDVRKEGLSTFRCDVTPAYDGTGWLEFRKGKTVLARQRFEPDTLVTTAKIPASVMRAIKVGDTITWGIYYEDGRKPVTAQFELVSKPAAAKKLAEMEADPRLARQPAVLRLQLEAEALQNYRLYSEALMKLLESHATDKSSTLPYSGIVSCLRRLDLEDTSLYSESASKAVGQASGLRGKGEVASVATNHPKLSTPSSSRSGTPAPGAPSRIPGQNPTANPGTTPPPPTETPNDQPTPPSDERPTNPPVPNPSALLRGEADRLASDAADQAKHAADAAAEATAAQGRAADAAAAAEAARAAALPASGDAPVEPSPAVAAADVAAAEATARAVEAARLAADAANRAKMAADAAIAADHRAKSAEQALPTSPTDPTLPGTVTAPSVPSHPAPSHPTPPGATLPTAPSGGNVTPPAPTVPAVRTALETAMTGLQSARDAATAASAALATAESDAQASPGDAAKVAAADAARLALERANEQLGAAQAELDRANAAASGR